MEPVRYRGEVVQFGPFEVDLKERELRKHGVRVKLQAQPFQVLLALLEMPGAAMTREELRRRIWPDDTFVDFEHGLNAAVTRLRQALGDSAGKAHYIQTVPKHGYRFCGELEGQSIASPAPEALTPVTRWRPRATLWVAMLLLTSAAGALLVFRSLYRPAPREGRTVPLTTLPGYEAHPAISPDDSQVAFTWNGEKRDNFDIYVMRIGSDTATRLTSDPAEDIRPAWSPDGSTIAFLRRSKGHRGELLLVRATGGPEHKIGEIRNMEFSSILGRFASLTWSPDGRWIATSHRGPNDACERIYLFSPRGEVRPLTSPGLSGHAGDQMPVFSPNGKALAVTRLTGFSTMNIHVLPLDANFNQAAEGRTVSSGSAPASFNPVWLPDGRILYVTGSWETRHRLAITRVNGLYAGERSLPDIEGSIEFAAGRRHLVYTRTQIDVNIWRADLPEPREPPSRSEPLICSTRIEGQAQYSPDGKRIAFQSSRSGSPEIWISKSDGSSPVRITNFGGPLTAFPNWSPDARSIVFHSRPEKQADLFVVPASGGTAKRLTMDPADDTSPSYSHDGEWIYFTSSRSGQQQIWKMPAGGGRAIQLTTSGGYRPVESQDGKTVFYSALDNTAIWRVPADGGQSAKVIDITHDYPSGFAVAAKGIYYVTSPPSSEQRYIQFFSFSTKQSMPVVLAGRPFICGMAVSPDSKYIAFDQEDEAVSDLMLVENFRVE